jgi:HlyD family secretion protein
MRRDRLLLIAAVAAFAPAGCGKQPAPSGAPAPPSGPQVAVVKPEMRGIKRTVEQPGTVHAFEDTALYAKFTGYVGAIADDPDKKNHPAYDRQIDRGSRVKKDQVLAELAVPELEQELKQKEAQVEQAAAEITQTEKSLAASEAAIDSAKALAKEAAAGVTRVQADVERWRSELTQADDLIKQKVIDAQSRAIIAKQFQASEASKAEAEARVESSAAAIRKAMADRDRIAADVAVARAQKRIAEANVGEVNARRSYLKIRAPFDGVVTRQSINTGDLVSAAEKIPLFHVARTDPVRVVVQVPEADAGLVAVGQPVRIALQALQGPAPTAKISRTAWSVESGSRTLWTEIDLPNEKGLVRPGMYVNARLTVELPPAWTVPAAAVGKAGEEAVIYLVEGGKATRVAAQLGRGDGQFTQVRRYKKPGTADWTDVTGTESVASPASALADGQAVR